MDSDCTRMLGQKLASQIAVTWMPCFTACTKGLLASSNVDDKLFWLYKGCYCPIAPSMIYAFHILFGGFTAATNIDPQIFIWPISDIFIFGK